jgi:hypothetical protein
VQAKLTESAAHITTTHTPLCHHEPTILGPLFNKQVPSHTLLPGLLRHIPTYYTCNDITY